MNVALVTTCKGRKDHLARTLPQNIKDNPEAKFIVVDYNDKDGLSDQLLYEHAEDIDRGRLAVYQYCEPVPFQMAHAKNLAHRLGVIEGGDVLVNVDADNFAGPGFADYVSEQFQDPGIFLWSRMVKNGEGRLPRGISGRIAVSRSDFFLAGGYDEKFKTHSPDDKDKHARLKRLGLEAREIDPKFLNAIPHNDKMRFKEYPEAAFSVSEDFDVHPESAVVNSGRIGCGTVFRNFFDSNPVIVEPVPTRVFGIGMHKTATTSLHHAFQILGFKSAHWESAHWAKAVWREIHGFGKSPTLERFYCACDLPIPLLFRQLDKAYPGSKFILTIRDEWSWLSSARKHWNPKFNKFRAGWDSDPFSNRIHNLLYGRTDFDPTTFLNRYRQHNSEVLEHFKDRRDDLLVMDMDNGDGWPELCQFLNMPNPGCAYPLIGAAQL